MTKHERLHAAVLSNSREGIQAALMALTGDPHEGYPLEQLKQIAATTLRHTWDGRPALTADEKALAHNALHVANLHTNEPPPDQPRDEGRWTATGTAIAAGVGGAVAGAAAAGLLGGAGKAVARVTRTVLGKGAGVVSPMAGKSLNEAAAAWVKRPEFSWASANSMKHSYDKDIVNRLHRWTAQMNPLTTPADLLRIHGEVGKALASAQASVHRAHSGPSDGAVSALSSFLQFTGATLKKNGVSANRRRNDMITIVDDTDWTPAQRAAWRQRNNADPQAGILRQVGERALQIAQAAHDGEDIDKLLATDHQIDALLASLGGMHTNYNENHDERGRFTRGYGAGAVTGTKDLRKRLYDTADRATGGFLGNLVEVGASAGLGATLGVAAGKNAGTLADKVAAAYQKVFGYNASTAVGRQIGAALRKATDTIRFPINGIVLRNWAAAAHSYGVPLGTTAGAALGATLGLMAVAHARSDKPKVNRNDPAIRAMTAHTRHDGSYRQRNNYNEDHDPESGKFIDADGQPSGSGSSASRIKQAVSTAVGAAVGGYVGAHASQEIATGIIKVLGAVSPNAAARVLLHTIGNIHLVQPAIAGTGALAGAFLGGKIGATELAKTRPSPLGVLGAGPIGNSAKIDVEDIITALMGRDEAGLIAALTEFKRKYAIKAMTHNHLETYMPPRINSIIHPALHAMAENDVDDLPALTDDDTVDPAFALPEPTEEEDDEHLAGPDGISPLQKKMAKEEVARSRAKNDLALNQWRPRDGAEYEDPAVAAMTACL